MDRQVEEEVTVVREVVQVAAAEMAAVAAMAAGLGMEGGMRVMATKAEDAWAVAGVAEEEWVLVGMAVVALAVVARVAAVEVERTWAERQVEMVGWLACPWGKPAGRLVAAVPAEEGLAVERAAVVTLAAAALVVAVKAVEVQAAVAKVARSAARVALQASSLASAGARQVEEEGAEAAWDVAAPAPEAMVVAAMAEAGRGVAGMVVALMVVRVVAVAVQLEYQQAGTGVGEGAVSEEAGSAVAAAWAAEEREWEAAEVGETAVAESVGVAMAAPSEGAAEFAGSWRACSGAGLVAGE